MPIAEDDVTDVEGLCTALFPSGGVFARAHREKECHDGQVGGGCLGRAVADRLAGATKFVHSAKEFGGDGFLTVRRRVQVGERVQEGGNPRSEGRSSFDVKGAWFEMLP